ncbi:uncharacterized protein LOC119348076 [Triticum dicoccoides]|uniref:uncharacterized protein LOC119289435 n=1 Tax=Triticum dicoccoides TaxID=85692 RepID=UPI0018902F43|nr:uncharacterized protein LOC119289435 [Triticum dicoccoides]XP_037472354.1 uncharacterized protein LOC119348076 [Triticum dicoccoides]
MVAAQEPRKECPPDLRSGLFSADDFRTYSRKLWVQPEMEELRTAFSKLRKLFVCGIFVEFDISWMTAFLQQHHLSKCCILRYGNIHAVWARPDLLPTMTERVLGGKCTWTAAPRTGF